MYKVKENEDETNAKNNEREMKEKGKTWNRNVKTAINKKRKENRNNYEMKEKKRMEIYTGECGERIKEREIKKAAY